MDTSHLCDGFAAPQNFNLNETLNWLSSLPISMQQDSFWRWQCSVRYSLLLVSDLSSGVSVPACIPLLPGDNSHLDSGIAQWLQLRTRDRKVAGFECRREWQGHFLLSPGSTFCANSKHWFTTSFLWRKVPESGARSVLSVLTLISVSVPPPCYCSST